MTALESRDASPAPNTPQRKPKIKSAFMKIFSKFMINEVWKDSLAYPRALMTAEQQQNRAING